MFKIIYPILLAVFAVVLFNCDGRERASKTNTEIFTDSNLSQDFKHTLKLIPETYSEIKTDTLINKSLRLQIHYHSLNKEKVVVYTEHSSIEHSNFQALVSINFKEKEIFEGLINKYSFVNYVDQNFLNTSIMQYIWIDYEDTSEKMVMLNVSLFNPQFNSYKDFSIKIPTDGDSKPFINEINLLKNSA